MRYIALITLLLLLLSGCARTEYIELRPQCTPPSQPALPALDKGELWQALGDAEYRVLETYINRIWAFSDEQAAMLGVLCDT